MRDAVVLGQARQNFGLQEVAADEVHIRLFEKGVCRQARRLSRATWRPF